MLLLEYFGALHGSDPILFCLRFSISFASYRNDKNNYLDIRGAFGKFLAWHHNSTMLSNNTFSETRIQRQLNDLNFVDKGLGIHVQCMLKTCRVYTLAETLSKIFIKKKQRKIGDLIYDHGLTN